MVITIIIKSSVPSIVPGRIHQTLKPPILRTKKTSAFYQNFQITKSKSQTISNIKILMTKTNLSFERLRRSIALAMWKENFTKEIIFLRSIFEWFGAWVFGFFDVDAGNDFCLGFFDCNSWWLVTGGAKLFFYKVLKALPTTFL